MLFFNKIKKYLFETFYDLWLLVGSRFYFIEILLETQNYVMYELMTNNRKIRKRKDFIEMDSDYGK